MKLYWKGSFLEAEEAKVPVFNEDYFSGSALVETMHVLGGKVLNLKLHLSRFSDGARAMDMPAPDLEGFARVARQLIKVNRLKRGALRCRYFRDASLLMHPLPAPAAGRSARGIRLMTTPVRHYGPLSLQGRLKANSMLPNLLSRWESQAWAEDGLRLTEAGFVAEGVWTNIIVQKRGVWMTPPLSQGVLEGTTRSIAMEKWRKKGGKVLETPLTRFDLYTADRAWVCSSLRWMIRIAQVDGRKVG